MTMREFADQLQNAVDLLVDVQESRLTDIKIPIRVDGGEILLIELISKDGDKEYKIPMGWRP